jgi:hypothetical protein
MLQHALAGDLRAADRLPNLFNIYIHLLKQGGTASLPVAQ